MIKAENISYSFPQKDIYNNISFTLEEDQHCAFIGTSGTGKSTLVDMIMNPDKYMFDGRLEIELGLRIGYVSQFYQLDKTSEITVYEYIAEDFVKLQNEITSICAAMETSAAKETSAELEPLLEQYQQAIDAFNAIGGDDFESNITKKLNLAGLGKHADQMVSKLSGGEYKLVQVIKEMLTLPDLMIMDEPDVFLDFDRLIALKNLINSYKGCMLVITHNRYLLNHCFNKIMHLENTELQEFDGRYIDYNFSLLQRKIELQELAAADTLEIERNQNIVDKLRRDATNFTSASRGKSLNARVSLLQRLETRRIKAPFVDIKQPEITFYTEKRSAEEIVLNVRDYSISFDDTLLENVSFEMKALEKAALIGPNGTGKTTLLRDIFKHEKLSIEIPENTEAAFLSQLQGEMLQESNTVTEEFFDAGFKTYDEIASCLSKFNFKEELMNQRISSLSGGEKNLLQLAKLSAGKANLLLLDEPTSHLDTYSQAALEKAIEDYNGAILMVSHDFYFIANCMDYVIFIEDKTIRRISIRKFRKMIYAKHFDKDYLETEQRKKAVELKIALALRDLDFAAARELSEELEGLIKLL